MFILTDIWGGEFRMGILGQFKESLGVINIIDDIEVVM